jgi:hypothetical protein
LRRSRRALSNLDRDIEDHLAEEIQEHIDRGLSPEEARRAALRAFGNVTLAKENAREVWFVRWRQELLQDARYGLRALRRSPGFAAVAILTLALGIGANTVVFSAVNGVLVEHLPYANAPRLVTIARRQVAYEISFDEVRAITAQCPAFDRLAIYDEGFPLVLGAATPDHRAVTNVSADFFPMLGVAPLLGRSIVSEDAEADRPAVAVLSFRFWMDGFGGDPGVVGRQLLVGAQTYTVVGVMPKTFELGVDWLGENGEGMWVPMTPSSLAKSRGGGDVIARLRPGVPISTAKAQLSVVSAVLSKVSKRFPANAEGVELVATPPALLIAPALRIGLLILLGAVACVLLLASVNVSALLIARARTRTAAHRPPAPGRESAARPGWRCARADRLGVGHAHLCVHRAARHAAGGSDSSRWRRALVHARHLAADGGALRSASGPAGVLSPRRERTQAGVG